MNSADTVTCGRQHCTVASLQISAPLRKFLVWSGSKKESLKKKKVKVKIRFLENEKVKVKMGDEYGTTSCGLSTWRPKWLQIFASRQVFTILSKSLQLKYMRRAMP